MVALWTAALSLAVLGARAEAQAGDLALRLLHRWSGLGAELGDDT